MADSEPAARGDRAASKPVDAGGNDGGGEPVRLQIRRVIFENFNDPDRRFTNDEVFEIMRRDHNSAGGGLSDVCDLESEFGALCRSGLARNIAQNFNTMWLMLFDEMREVRCGACSRTVHIGGSEEQECPNPSCGAPVGQGRA